MTQKLADKPTATTNKRTTAEERELAVLAQFVHHDSVASLAKAIAARSGGSVRAGDLIAAAGLGPGAGGS
jgi:hypothetical protein